MIALPSCSEAWIAQSHHHEWKFYKNKPHRKEPQNDLQATDWKWQRNQSVVK